MANRPHRGYLEVFEAVRQPKEDEMTSVQAKKIARRKLSLLLERRRLA